MHKSTNQPQRSQRTPRPVPRKLLLNLMLGFCLPVATSAGASAGSAYYVMAPVLSVDPIIVQQQIERPIQHCTDYRSPQVRHDDRYDQRHQRQQNRFLPSLLGGLVGGLVGNQFGGGNGKKIFTVVGALAGSSIANDVARERRQAQRYAEPVRRNCYTTYERENIDQIDGYHVVYEYAGQEFSKTLEKDPGDQVQVLVELSPGAQL